MHFRSLASFSLFGLAIAIVGTTLHARPAVQVLHRFAGGTTDGYTPEGGLSVIGSTIYGTTDWGGSADGGVLYRYEPVTNSYAVVHHFTGNSIEPASAPIQVGSKLYGTTYGVNVGRPGTIYSFDPVTSAYATLHTFSNERGPFGGLTQVGSQLWGVTNFGGAGDRRGVLFSYDLNTNQYTMRHGFGGSDGAVPEGRLTLIGTKLYGTTGEGGSNSVGTIFSFDTQTNAFAKLHDFNRAVDGAFPYSHLTPVGSKLYGTSVLGGADDNGTIYSFDPTNNSVQLLHDFEGTPTDGRCGYAGLIAVDSTLYGMTAFGGTANRGAVFSLDLSNSGYQTLHSFDVPDGYQTQFGFVQLGSNLYATTLFGGGGNSQTNGNGVLFSFAIPEPTSLWALVSILIVSARRPLGAARTHRSTKLAWD